MTPDNVSVTQLHIKTGIRHDTLSALTNNRRQRIQLDHLDKIVNTLNIKDMNELFRIEEDGQ
ncbi:helix-turn-helix domain-containing protein [Gracilibacillus alcaliphilus]|uniref:helix-turn-helix domain-containing protein n=1 Tax=Gracilibacillus alcaliphilus TaxID=1401441 RepID=UPI0019584C71|nr:DNA-binding Xre family transcriptional regulator [Gracilibacillus alcaliphilus]